MGIDPTRPAVSSKQTTKIQMGTSAESSGAPMQCWSGLLALASDGSRHVNSRAALPLRLVALL